MSRREAGYRQETPAPRVRGEGGFTLVELLVAMGIFTTLLTFMVVAIGAMVTDLRKTQGIADASDQARRAFERLDKQVRYADAINAPTKVGTNWYVEFRTTDVQQRHLCRQWRLVTGTDQLQQRSWTADTTPSPAPAWSPMAFGVVNDLTTQPPFGFLPATIERPHQQLTLRLVVRRGAKPSGTAETRTTFAARNTTTTTETNDATSTGVQSATPVCTEAGRP